MRLIKAWIWSFRIVGCSHTASQHLLGSSQSQNDSEQFWRELVAMMEWDQVIFWAQQPGQAWAVPSSGWVLVAIWSGYYEISPPSSSRIHQRSNFTPVTSDTLLHIHSVIEFGVIKTVWRCAPQLGCKCKYIKWISRTRYGRLVTESNTMMMWDLYHGPLLSINVSWIFKNFTPWFSRSLVL